MIVVGLIMLAATVSLGWRIVQWRLDRVGDGRAIDSYGFDLSNLPEGISPKTIAATRYARDGQPVLNAPKHLTIEEVENRNNRFGSWSRLLTSKELVIGVEREGVARAYPIKFVRMHEIVNDALGEHPVCVTYSPLTDSVVVFDRRLGDEVLDFGYSGLLYNANLLLYDRQKNGGTESLWSQLKFQAIAGPRAGQALKVLPMFFGRYIDWRTKHPKTTVMVGADEHKAKYKQDVYWPYLKREKLKENFPIEPLVPEVHPKNGLRRFETILAHRINGQWRPVPIFADQPVSAEANVRARWFAWAAMHGDAGWMPAASPKQP